ncbi:hypothetical protein CCAE64S_01494 [Castellaniella caeni]
MTTTYLIIDPKNVPLKTAERVDWQRVDATTEDDIARQYAQDEAAASRDAARFARRVRLRLGLSQVQFSQQVGVSLDTIRNWEQGKRSPTGAAKALLTILDRAPEAAMDALRKP